MTLNNRKQATYYNNLCVIINVLYSFRKQCEPCPDPLNSLYQADSHYGSINERMEVLIDKFNSKNLKKKDKKTFENILKLKTMQSYCSAGEPVGLLAAQVTKTFINNITATLIKFILVNWRALNSNDIEHLPFRWKR